MEEVVAEVVTCGYRGAVEVALPPRIWVGACLPPMVHPQNSSDHHQPTISPQTPAEEHLHIQRIPLMAKQTPKRLEYLRRHRKMKSEVLQARKELEERFKSVRVTHIRRYVQ